MLLSLCPRVSTVRRVQQAGKNATGAIVRFLHGAFRALYMMHEALVALLF